MPEYWIVDLDGRRVEQWHPNDASPETLTEALAWQSDRFTEPLVIDLRAYFARVLRETPRRNPPRCATDGCQLQPATAA